MQHLQWSPMRELFFHKCQTVFSCPNLDFYRADLCVCTILQLPLQSLEKKTDSAVVCFTWLILNSCLSVKQRSLHIACKDVSIGVKENACTGNSSLFLNQFRPQTDLSGGIKTEWSNKISQEPSRDVSSAIIWWIDSSNWNCPDNTRKGSSVL